MVDGASPVLVARSPHGPDLLHLALFGFDQVVEPADVALRGVQLVLHERERVAVDPLPVLPQRFLEGRASPFQEGPAPLEQADSRLGLEVPEEREPDREPVVLGGLLPHPLQELGEHLLALGRDAIDVLAPPDVFLGEDHLDGALRLEALERRIERAIRHLPEAPQGIGQALLQLVAVHGALLEESQDRQLEHVVRCLLSGRYIHRIYRHDISDSWQCQPSDQSVGVRGRAAPIRCRP